MTDKEPTTQRTSQGQQQPALALPPGYSCLYPGDTYATRRAMQLAHERGVEVFVRIEGSGRYTRTAAYLVPSDILAAVVTEARATEAERAAKRVAREQASAKAHVLKLGQVADLIRRLFPAIPAAEAERAALRVHRIGSVRDWRAGGVSDERVLSVMRGYIQDKHTEYSSLFPSGWDKDAQQRVSDQIDAVLARWSGDTQPDCKS